MRMLIVAHSNSNVWTHFLIHAIFIFVRDCKESSAGQTDWLAWRERMHNKCVCDYDNRVCLRCYVCVCVYVCIDDHRRSHQTGEIAIRTRTTTNTNNSECRTQLGGTSRVKCAACTFASTHKTRCPNELQTHIRTTVTRTRARTHSHVTTAHMQFGKKKCYAHCVCVYA